MFQVSVRPISSENMKESKKSVPVGRKESSVSLNPSEDQGNGASPESQPLPSISSTQLVYVAADLDKLQDQVCACDFTYKRIFVDLCANIVWHLVKDIKLFKIMYHKAIFFTLNAITGVV